MQKSTLGVLQVCMEVVDRAEKGLHCSNNGHRICWSCMVGHVNWQEVLTNKPDIFTLSTINSQGCNE